MAQFCRSITAASFIFANRSVALGMDENKQMVLTNQLSARSISKPNLFCTYQAKQHSSRLPIPKSTGNRDQHVHAGSSVLDKPNRTSIVTVQSVLRRTLARQKSKDCLLLIRLVQSAHRRSRERERHRKLLDEANPFSDSSNYTKKMTYAGSIFATPLHFVKSASIAQRGSNATCATNGASMTASPLITLHGKRLMTPTPQRIYNQQSIMGSPARVPAKKGLLRDPMSKAAITASTPSITTKTLDSLQSISINEHKLTPYRKTANSEEAAKPTVITARKAVKPAQSRYPLTGVLTPADLNHITQVNTNRNAVYEHVVPAVIVVEMEAPAPGSPSDAFKVGKKSRWDGCISGQCRVALMLERSGEETSGGFSKRRVTFMSTAKVIGHAAECQHHECRSPELEITFPTSSCLKPKSGASLTAASAVTPKTLTSKTPVQIQRIIYSGANAAGAPKSAQGSAKVERPKRCLGGAKPRRTMTK